MRVWCVSCVVCWCPVFYGCGFFLSGVIAFFLLLFFFLVMRRQLFLLLRLLLLQFLSTLLPLVECQNSSTIAPIANTVFIPPYNYTQCQESNTFRILDAQRSFNASTNLYSLNVTGRSLISVANLSSTGTCNKRYIWLEAVEARNSPLHLYSICISKSWSYAWQQHHLQSFGTVMSRHCWWMSREIYGYGGDSTCRWSLCCSCSCWWQWTHATFVFTRNLHCPTHHCQWEISLYAIQHSRGKWSHGCAWHWHLWDISILLGSLFLSTSQSPLQCLPLLYHSLLPLPLSPIPITTFSSLHPTMQCFQQPCDSRHPAFSIWFTMLNSSLSWVNSISIIQLFIPCLHPTLHGAFYYSQLVGFQNLLHAPCLKWAWQTVLDVSMIALGSLSMERAWTTLLWLLGSISIACSWHPLSSSLWSWLDVYWCVLSSGWWSVAWHGTRLSNTKHKTPKWQILRLVSSGIWKSFMRC